MFTKTTVCVVEFVNIPNKHDKQNKQSKLNIVAVIRSNIG